jgi:hypothetical protein
MFTMEFLDSEEERMYIKDVWSRESWRFVLTTTIAACTYLFNLVVGAIREPESIRMISLFVCVALAALAVVQTVLLWKSERGSDRCGYLFKCARTPMQFLVILVTMVYSFVHTYNTFHGCKQEHTYTLYQCKTMKMDSGITHEALIFICLTPLVLKFLNVPFRWVVIFSTIGYIQLVAITVRVSPKNAPNIWRLVPIYTWGVGFLIYAAWHVENTDRKSYLLRLEMEKRHVKQLKVTQLQTKAAAEETLVS